MLHVRRAGVSRVVPALAAGVRVLRNPWSFPPADLLHGYLSAATGAPVFVVA